jgi:hypothetical protein
MCVAPIKAKAAVSDDMTKLVARYGSLARPRNTADICGKRF